MPGLSRFNVQASAQQAPGHCVFCGGVKGPFIHTGTQLRLYGTVLVCFNCLREMSTNLPDKDREVVVIERVHDYGELNDIVDGLAWSIERLNAELSRMDIPEISETKSADDSGADSTAESDSESSSESEPSGISGDSSDGELAELVSERK